MILPQNFFKALRPIFAIKNDFRHCFYCINFIVYLKTGNASARCSRIILAEAPRSEINCRLRENSSRAIEIFLPFSGDLNSFSNKNSRAFKNWMAFCLFADDSDNNSFSSPLFADNFFTISNLLLDKAAKNFRPVSISSFSKSSLPEETSITVSLERSVGMTFSIDGTIMKKWILSPGSSKVFKSALDDSMLKEKTSITKTFPRSEKDFVAAQLVRLWLSFMPNSPNRLNEKSG